MFRAYTWKVQILIYVTLEFQQDMIRNEYFMTINIFVLKGDLNGENRSGAFLFLSGIFHFR